MDRVVTIARMVLVAVSIILTGVGWSGAMAEDIPVKDLLARGGEKAREGNYAGAIEDYTGILAREPELAEVYLLRGYARAGLGDQTRAIGDYTRAIAIKPDSAQSFLGRGAAQEALANPPGAIADYRRAARLFLEQGNTAGHERAAGLAGKLESTYGLRQ
ncbi:MAG: tetratricopeptide repeat protein [Gemmatimonadaceae bacterium]|nr:tetratricopeptide repeat protein [Gloeobacterales cyanobacterium ES-bin-141]